MGQLDIVVIVIIAVNVLMSLKGFNDFFFFSNDTSLILEVYVVENR